MHWKESGIITFLPIAGLEGMLFFGLSMLSIYCVHHYNSRLDADFILQLYKLLKKLCSSIFSKIKFWHLWQDKSFSCSFCVCFIAITPMHSGWQIGLSGLANQTSSANSLTPMNTLSSVCTLSNGKVLLTPPQTLRAYAPKSYTQISLSVSKINHQQETCCEWYLFYHVGLLEAL